MKQKDILMILIPTFVITLLWVLFSVYHNLTTSTIKSPLDIQIIPIVGKFDQQAIDQIKSRQIITPEYNSIVAPDSSISPTPTPTSIPTGEIADEEFTEEEAITPTTSPDEEFIEDEIPDDEEFIEE